MGTRSPRNKSYCIFVHVKIRTIISEIHPWNIYLYVNALWSFFAAIMYSQFPESPKFLLSQNQENKALDILKYIYCKNTGNDEESFPVSFNYINILSQPLVKRSFRLCAATWSFRPASWSVTHVQ